MKTLTIAIVVMIIALSSVKRIQACYQPESPFVRLRSRFLRGTVTLNGKPIANAALSLHKLDYGAIGDADPHVLSRTSTTNSGKFSFGEIPNGKYVIVMHSPSNEYTEAELIKAEPSEDDTIAIEFFGYFCQRAAALTAEGKRLSQSTPTIFGRP
jgi:hypothetical protein